MKTNTLLMLVAFIAIAFPALCDPFPPGATGILQPGDTSPQFAYTDIEGKPGVTGDLDGWVIAYFFADRYSNERLMAWMDNACINIARSHPGIRIAFISFADLKAVPSLFRGIVRPILKAINSRASERMKRNYIKAEIKLDLSKTRFALIPDWSGEYMKMFGLGDAIKYQCFVSRAGRISAYMAESPETPGLFEKAITDAYQGPVTGPATTIKTREGAIK
jgi:hypothetical protein